MLAACYRDNLLSHRVLMSLDSCVSYSLVDEMGCLSRRCESGRSHYLPYAVVNCDKQQRRRVHLSGV